MRCLRWWGGLAVFGISLGMYSVSLPHHITGVADSDELITHSVVSGVAHYPSYPLLLYVTSLWQRLPLPFSPFTMANLFNAVLQATANTIWFFILMRLFRTSAKNTGEMYGVAAVVAALQLAGNYLIWQYAIVFEVFSLQNVLVSLIFYLSLRWTSMPLFLMGFAVFHHQSCLLLLPFVLYFLRRRCRSRPLVSMGSLLSGLGAGAITHGGLLIYEWQHRNLHSWYVEPTLSGWWRILSRQAYGGYSVESGMLGSPLVSNLDVSQSLQSLSHYLFHSLPDHFGWFLPFIVVGMYRIITKSRYREFIPYLLCIFITGPLLGAYLTIPPRNETMRYYLERGLTERMYLLGYPFFIIPGFIGLITIFHLNHARHKGLTYLMLFGLMIVPFFINRELFTYAKQQEVSQALEKTMKSLNQGALIVCYSDLSCFGMRALQQIENIRPDLVILPSSPYMAKTVLDANPQLSTFSYFDNPFMILDVVGTVTSKNQWVYMIEEPDVYRTLLGISNGVFKRYREGLVTAIGCDETFKPFLPVPIQAKVKPAFSERNSFYRYYYLYVTKRQSEPSLEGSCATLTQAKPHSNLQEAWWAVVRFPNNMDTRLHFAQVLEAQAMDELAKREYRHVLELDAHNPAGLEALKRLNQVKELGNFLEAD